MGTVMKLVPQHYGVSCILWLKNFLQHLHQMNLPEIFLRSHCGFQDKMAGFWLQPMFGISAIFTQRENYMTAIPSGNPLGMGRACRSVWTGWRWDLNPEHWRCEAAMLTTKPLRPQQLHYIFALKFCHCGEDQAIMYSPRVTCFWRESNSSMNSYL